MFNNILKHPECCSRPADSTLRKNIWIKNASHLCDFPLSVGCRYQTSYLVQSEPTNCKDSKYLLSLLHSAGSIQLWVVTCVVTQVYASDDVVRSCPHFSRKRSRDEPLFIVHFVKPWSSSGGFLSLQNSRRFAVLMYYFWLTGVVQCCRNSCGRHVVPVLVLWQQTLFVFLLQGDIQLPLKQPFTTVRWNLSVHYAKFGSNTFFMF